MPKRTTTQKGFVFKWMQLGDFSVDIEKKIPFIYLTRNMCQPDQRK